ncbi:MAG TPA: putative quinol monooxygenase [Rhizomicrobium sp.]|jgi:quinol monooxygenase YgiN|nr:putative quinol monooxygenase [Rhizomicrobium sp.]
MEFDTIIRFHAKEGREDAIAAAMRDAAEAVRAEPGCLGIEYFRALRDSRLFYIHSRWADEAAFQIHANLPHTLRFLEQVEGAIDHELEVTRVRPLA